MDIQELFCHWVGFLQSRIYRHSISFYTISPDLESGTQNCLYESVCNYVDMYVYIRVALILVLVSPLGPIPAIFDGIGIGQTCYTSTIPFICASLIIE